MDAFWVTLERESSFTAHNHFSIQIRKVFKMSPDPKKFNFKLNVNNNP